MYRITYKLRGRSVTNRLSWPAQEKGAFLLNSAAQLLIPIEVGNDHTCQCKYYTKQYML